MFHDSSMSAGFFNGNQTTNGSPSKAKTGNQNRMNNILPVCIRQLLSAPGDEFVLFRMRAQIVSIVGILREYDVSSIRATYQIEDHTGTIKACLWLDTDAVDTLSNLPPVKEGRYLKLFGSLRVNDNEKTILVLKMIPVEDPNIITTHLLQVIHARYAAEKLNSEGSFKKNINNPGAALANTMSNLYEDHNSGTSFTPIQTKIHNILKADTSMNGLHLNVLLSNFQQNQRADVHKAIEFLQSEGHIYSTIDATHFKSTD